LRFYETTHRGVHAACDIKKDQELLFIPHKLLITNKVVKLTPLGDKVD